MTEDEIKEKEERPVDIIRRMNPGSFIPTGEELSKMLRVFDPGFLYSLSIVVFS